MPSKRPRLLSVPIIIFLVAWGQSTHSKPSVDGDDPHYLIVTQSLVADGDLDVANNYEADHGSLFGSQGLKAGLHAKRTPSGRLLPVHDVGLSILVLPAYRVATAIAPLVPERLLARFRMPPGLFAHSLVCLFLLAMTSAGWWLVARALAESLGVGKARLLTLFFALSPTLMANGALVFPEVPALFIVSLVIAKAYGSERIPGWLVLLAIGLLPWFHRKFLLMGFGLLVVLAARCYVRSRRLVPRFYVEAAIFAGVPVALLFAWTYSTWGSFGGPLTTGRVPLSWSVFKAGSLGMFFDREYGIVPWAPAALLLPFAWAAAGRRAVLLLLPAVLLYIPCAAHDIWWAGWAPAGRFLVPAAPLAAIAVALVRPIAFPRFVTPALVALQIGISAWVWQRPRILWNFGDGHNRMLEALPYGQTIELVFPSYATDPNAWVPGLAWLAALSLVTFALLIRRRQVA